MRKNVDEVMLLLVSFSVDTQGSVDAILEFTTLCFEPLQHIIINGQRNCSFAFRYSPLRTREERIVQRRNVRSVNVVVVHVVNASPVGF